MTDATQPPAPGAATPTAALVELEPPPPTATDAIVSQWVVDWFHNIGLPTPLQNRISLAVADLKARLQK